LDFRWHRESPDDTASAHDTSNANSLACGIQISDTDPIVKKALLSKPAEMLEFWANEIFVLLNKGIKQGANELQIHVLLQFSPGIRIFHA
jgi:hypothetical protein